MDNDNEKIKEYNERQRKYMSDIATVLKMQMGFNMSDNVFEVGANDNGPVLKIRTHINEADISKLPPLAGGTKWEIGMYNLTDSGRPQYGMYCMVNGESVFIPIEKELDATKVYNAETPQEMATLLEGANPGGIFNITPEGEIEAVIQNDANNSIQLPQGFVMDEATGLIYNPSFADRYFKVNYVNAHDADRRAESSADADKVDTYNEDLVGNSPINKDENHSEELDLTEEEELQQVEKLGLSNEDFDIKKMVYASSHYVLHDDHATTKSTEYRSSSSLTIEKEKDPRILRSLKLCEMWNDACLNSGLSPMPDGVLNTSIHSHEDIETIMKLGESLQGRSFKDVCKALFDNEFQGLKGQVAIRFLGHKAIAENFNFDMSEMSVEDALSKLNSYENQSLKDQAKELFPHMQNSSDLQMEEEMVDDFVMERKFPNGNFDGHY